MISRFEQVHWHRYLPHANTRSLSYKRSVQMTRSSYHRHATLSPHTPVDYHAMSGLQYTTLVPRTVPTRMASFSTHTILKPQSDHIPNPCCLRVYFQFMAKGHTGSAVNSGFALQSWWGTCRFVPIRLPRHYSQCQ